MERLEHPGHLGRPNRGTRIADRERDEVVTDADRAIVTGASSPQVAASWTRFPNASCKAEASTSADVVP